MFQINLHNGFKILMLKKISTDFLITGVIFGKEFNVYFEKCFISSHIQEEGSYVESFHHHSSLPPWIFL